MAGLGLLSPLLLRGPTARVLRSNLEVRAARAVSGLHAGWLGQRSLLGPERARRQVGLPNLQVPPS